MLRSNAGRVGAHEIRGQVHNLLRWLTHPRLDIPLLAGLAMLAITGLVVLYSASGQSLAIVWRQTANLAIAFTALLVMAQIPPERYKLWTPWLYGLGILLLIAVLLTGAISKGAQRWLDVGIVRFQPSELMKIALPMMLAWSLSTSPLPPTGRRLALCFVAMALPIVLIARQPDLGTALLIFSAGIAVLFMAGLSWRFMVGAALIMAPAAFVLWHFGMHDYQRQRVLTFLDPQRDPLGAGYHIIQSMIAVGSGGLYGKGWLNSTQSHLDFLPEPTTDFVFAVFAEEFGLIGALLLLSVYLFLIARGLYIAAQAHETYTRVLAGSIALTFFVYLTVNVGMVIGLMPVVGVPLPLLSYGGSSLVTLMAGFGILTSIHTHRKLIAR